MIPFSFGYSYSSQRSLFLQYFGELAAVAVLIADHAPRVLEGYQAGFSADDPLRT